MKFKEVYLKYAMMDRINNLKQKLSYKIFNLTRNKICEKVFKMNSKEVIKQYHEI